MPERTAGPPEPTAGPCRATGRAPGPGSCAETRPAASPAPAAQRWPPRSTTSSEAEATTTPTSKAPATPATRPRAKPKPQPPARHVRGCDAVTRQTVTFTGSGDGGQFTGADLLDLVAKTPELAADTEVKARTTIGGHLKSITIQVER